MLRFVVPLAILVLRASPAAAQAAEAVDAAKQAVAQIQHDGVPGPIAVVGLLAVAAVVVVLGLVIKALWNTIKERDAATEAMRTRYDTALAAVQEKRAAELIESTKQVASTAISGSAAITASNERLADTAGRVQTLAERVLPLPEAITRIEGRLNEVARTCGRGPA